jgi:hypothetical protein
MVRKPRHIASKLLIAGLGLASATYATYAGLTWLRYGKPKPSNSDNVDPALDAFMPGFDVVDRFQVRIKAPPDVSLAAVERINLTSSRLVRAIFKAREWILRSKPDDFQRPTGFTSEMKSLGWVALKEIPGRELVFGAATKPWEANPVFRSIPAEEFLAFKEPDFVKIALTLRADPDGDSHTMFRTETRAVATDAEARRKMRWYWSLLSPGIIAIRRILLPRIKAEAEQPRLATTHDSFPKHLARS